jgi:hypothetical protein
LACFLKKNSQKRYTNGTLLQAEASIMPKVLAWQKQAGDCGAPAAAGDGR